MNQTKLTNYVLILLSDIHNKMARRFGEGAIATKELGQYFQCERVESEGKTFVVVRVTLPIDATLTEAREQTERALSDIKL